MRYGRFFALMIAAGLSQTAPVAAQSCNDDIAGLTVDENGNYVMKSKTQSSAQADEPQMSRVPQDKTETSDVPAAMAAAIAALRPKPDGKNGL